MKCMKKKIASSKELLLFIIEKGFRNNKQTLMLVLIQNILSVISSVASIVFTKELINAISLHSKIRYILFNLGGVTLCLILDNLISNVILHRISISERILKKEMEIALHKHAAKLPYNYIESLEGQEDLEKAITGIELTGGVFENANIIVEAGIKLFSMIFWLIYIGDVSGTFIGFLILICLVKNIVRKNEIRQDKNLNMKQALINRQYRYIFGEMFSCNAGKVIRTYKAEKFIEEESTLILKKIFSVLQEICNMTISNNVIIQILDAINLCVIIVYGYFWIISNGMFIGDYSLFIAAFGKIIDYGVKSITNINQFLENANSYNDYKKYMDNLEEIHDGIIVDKIDTVEFRNVSFVYPYGTNKVLKDVSFNIASNQKVAIVGNNGSGKTTIIKLLMGFYKPLNGEILINNINMEKFDLEYYRAHVGLVDQYFRVFEGSISENVTCNSEREYVKFEECIKRADIYEKILSLSAQEETYIGRYLNEEGINLSGGERQKLCIARGIYKNGSMLILDEPTSAMDVYSRERFEKNFLDTSNENIVIYITHNIKSVLKCDSAIMIDNGQIVEMGKIDELIENKNSNFYRMIFNEENCM